MVAEQTIGVPALVTHVAPTGVQNDPAVTTRGDAAVTGDFVAGVFAGVSAAAERAWRPSPPWPKWAARTLLAPPHNHREVPPVQRTG